MLSMKRLDHAFVLRSYFIFFHLLQRQIQIVILMPTKLIKTKMFNLYRAKKMVCVPLLGRTAQGFAGGLHHAPRFGFVVFGLEAKEQAQLILLLGQVYNQRAERLKFESLRSFY